MAVNVCLTKNGRAHSSRTELLDWINNCLDARYQKIEEMCSGVAYCQLMHALFPDSLQVKRIKTNASCEYEYMENFKLLKKAFDIMHVNKIVPFNDLVKGRFYDNLEFMQWFNKFYEANCHGVGDNINHDEDDYIDRTPRTYAMQRSHSMNTKRLTVVGDCRRRPEQKSSYNNLKKRLQRSHTISQMIGDGKPHKEPAPKRQRCTSATVQTLEWRRRNASKQRRMDETVTTNKNINTLRSHNNPSPRLQRSPRPPPKPTKNIPQPTKSIQKVSKTSRLPPPVKLPMPLPFKELQAKVKMGRENIQYMKAVNRFYLHKIRNIMGLCLENDEPELQAYAKRVLYIISRKTSCISLDPEDDADYANI